MPFRQTQTNELKGRFYSRYTLGFVVPQQVCYYGFSHTYWQTQVILA